MNLIIISAEYCLIESTFYFKLYASCRAYRLVAAGKRPHRFTKMVLTLKFSVERHLPHPNAIGAKIQFFICLVFYDILECRSFSTLCMCLCVPCADTIPHNTWNAIWSVANDRYLSTSIDRGLLTGSSNTADPIRIVMDVKIKHIAPCSVWENSK